MLSSKWNHSAIAGFVFVLGLFAWNSESGPASARLFESPLRNVQTKETNEPRQEPEPAWKTAFRRAYGLKDEEIIKRVASPFPACRKEFCRTLTELASDGDLDHFLLSYRWDGKNVEWWSFGVSDPGTIGWPLMSVLRDLGVPNQEMEGDIASRAPAADRGRVRRANRSRRSRNSCHD